MGDHGIDAYAVGHPLIKCARNNLDPRGHHKITELGLHTVRGHHRRDSKNLGVSSGLIGEKAGAMMTGCTEASAYGGFVGSRSVPSFSPNDEGIPAGCVSGRQAGRHRLLASGESVPSGEMGDHGIDAFAVKSSLHKSARSNLDPRDHHKLTRHNPRASISAGQARGAGVSSGLVGEKAGTCYFGHTDGQQFEHTLPRSDVSGFAPPRRAVRNGDAASDAPSQVSDCCVGMPFSHSACEEVSDFTRSLAKGHTGVTQKTIQLT